MMTGPIGLILLFPEALILKLRKAVLIAAPFVLFPKSEVLLKPAPGFNRKGSGELICSGSKGDKSYRSGHHHVWTGPFSQG